MYNILCFGDSNTFGTNPAGGRWPWEQRWTGLLQNELGSSYRIIEDGCGGRTTGLDDPIEGDRNGLRHLGVSLHSHRPLDLVILMLGTNDMKHRFSLLPIDIAHSAARLGELVQSYPYGPAYPVPKVLLVSPICSGRACPTVFTPVLPRTGWRFPASLRRFMRSRRACTVGSIWMPRAMPARVSRTTCTWSRPTTPHWPVPWPKPSAKR